MSPAEWVKIIFAAFGAFQGIYFCYSKGREILTFRRKTFLWKSNELGWAIIKPQYDGRKARIEDILAAQRLRDFFGKHDIPFVDSDDAKPPPKDKNLVLICGAEANKVSRAILKDLSLSYQYCYDDQTKKPYILDEVTQKRFWSPSDENGAKRDLALLAKVSPKNSECVYILCWGLHGPGTTGAAQMLLEKKFINEIRKSKKTDDFVAIVDVPYVTFDAIDKPALHSIRTGIDAYRRAI